MKRVDVYNRFYRPHLAPTGILLGGVCDALTDAGYDVRVCASRVKYGTAPGLARKIFIQFGYAAKALWFGLRQPKGTIAISATDPPYLNILVAIIGRIRGHRVIMWLPDRYPGLALVFRFIRKDGVLHRVWRRLDLWARANASAVVPLGEVMAHMVAEEGTAREKIRVIHNWIDADHVRPIGAAPHDDTVFLYAGNAGRAHRMDLLIRAIRSHQSDEDVAFWFAGNGYQLDDLRLMAERESWQHVRFLDYVPQEQLAQLLCSGDVGVVTESPDVIGLLVPSKFYNINAAGRPVLYIGPPNSDLAELIRRHECGVIVAPDNDVALNDAIEKLKDALVREEMGKRGRRAAVELYDMRHILPQWVALVQSLE